MVTYTVFEKSTVVFRSSQNNIIFSEIVVIKINTKALKRWIRILLVVQQNHNQYLSLFNTSKAVINLSKRLVIQRNWTLNGSYITTEFCKYIGNIANDHA